MDKLKLRTEQKLQNWQALQGRLAAAQWMSLTEPEVGREVTELETDALFKKLMYGGKGAGPVLRRSRWPASKLDSSFYEIQEHLAAGHDSADVQELLENHSDLIESIRKIGRENFEKYFLIGEDGVGLSEACSRTGIGEEEGRRILDLVLEVGAKSEFYQAAPDPRATGIRLHCIAALERDSREPQSIFFRFLSPHWARGSYVIDYEKLEAWKKSNELAGGERRRLRQILKKIELLNMRQDTLFQILSRTTTEQSAYLLSRKKHRRRPLSLRELARRIGVAPSTVSRAIGNRSVRLPWGEEVPFKSLLSGQRVVILSILAEWDRCGGLGEGVTDDQLMRRLAAETGITVSRRTVNECRRKLVGEPAAARGPDEA